MLMREVFFTYENSHMHVFIYFPYNPSIVWSPPPRHISIPSSGLISLGHLGSIAAYLFSQTHKAIPIFLKGGSVYYTGFFFPHPRTNNIYDRTCNLYTRELNGKVIK